MRLTPILVAILLKGPNIRAASSEGTALADSIVEVHGDQIGDLDKGRGPPSAIDATVQPVDRSVGTSGLSNVLWKGPKIERKFYERRREGLTGCTAGSTAVILNIDETRCVGGRVGSRARTGRGTWAWGGRRRAESWAGRGRWLRIRVLVVIGVGVVVTRNVLVGRGL